MQEKAIASRVAMERATVATRAGRRIAFTNSNALVGRLRGTIGVKSGFTSLAGKCVIAATERDGHRVWLVMLDAPNRWWVADGMIEAAFARLQRGGP
jgi:D-alanyl-D-alanine carboxypeptidase (penicillin-binding protein 5/6)